MSKNSFISGVTFTGALLAAAHSRVIKLNADQIDPSQSITRIDNWATYIDSIRTCGQSPSSSGTAADNHNIEYCYTRWLKNVALYTLNTRCSYYVFSSPKNCTFAISDNEDFRLLKNSSVTISTVKYGHVIIRIDIDYDRSYI